MTASGIHILVLGGGPAGAACAIGLVRLGYEVTLVTAERPWATVEGISERTVAGLRNAGFHHALAGVATPTPRYVIWNGEASRANTERIVDRPVFDAGLRTDLGTHGIHVIEGRVGTVHSDPSGHEVLVDQGGKSLRLCADFLVEARGRAARLTRSVRQRGIETVSLLQRWTGPVRQAGSAVQTFEDGWVWVAALGDGRRYVQATVDVASAGGAGRSGLYRFIDDISSLPLVRDMIADATPCGEPQARGSTPILCGNAVARRWIRVGDAAMAVDPLSGNGIFQSLSSALVAPAVINTLLQRPGQADLACAFYNNRLEHLFDRFSRMGRDFYRNEGRWNERPFWAARRMWPDDDPGHGAPDPASARVECRPVVRHGFIEERQVVVTNDQPLGMWHVDGIELAPVLMSLHKEKLTLSRPLADQLRSRFGLAPDKAEAVGRWLLAQGLVPDRPVAAEQK